MCAPNPPEKQKTAMPGRRKGMTVSYLQTRPLREEASLAFLHKVPRGRRCACLVVFIETKPGRRWAASKLVVKWRHPGGGECRHLILGPQPREEVKRWASPGFAFRQGGICKSVSRIICRKRLRMRCRGRTMAQCQDRPARALSGFPAL